MALEWLLQLDPAEQQQDDNDNQYQTQSSAGKITPGTVSYTHLDVYKRQVNVVFVHLRLRWSG